MTYSDQKNGPDNRNHNFNTLFNTVDVIRSQKHQKIKES
jgi:hypothetical protein